MKIAMLGLGKMGGKMVERLMTSGHECFVFDADAARTASFKAKGATPCASVEEVKEKIGPNAVVWLMLPSGLVTDQMVERVANVFESGDMVVDGGNSHFKDDVRHAALLAKRGIRFLDVGVSGGVWGLDRGYSLMIGGDQKQAERLEPVFSALAPGKMPNVVPTPGRGTPTSADRGYLYCGPTGAGHFVKMVHNGIEYGMMQAFAEGFDILRGSRSEELPAEFRYSLDLKEISEVWRRGSVVSSWLLDLIAISFNADPELARFEGHVPDSGEGRWTVQAAVEEGVPATVISAALFARFRSREVRSFAGQLLSAMRYEFGGHAEAPVKFEKKSA